MAEETEQLYPISQIKIGDKTFEIVDAVARDSVSLIYKWGRPGSDPRAYATGNDTGYNSQDYFIIAHLLPNINDRFLKHKNQSLATTYQDSEDQWKTDWNYPENFSVVDVLKHFSFAFGQLNLHSAGGSGRNIRHFVSKTQKNQQESSETLNYYKDNRPGIYTEWAWATFYTAVAWDVVTTNTFITSQENDIMGTFGLTSTGTVKNIYGNATTVIFSHVSIDYNNLLDEPSEEESSSNNGS